VAGHQRGHQCVDHRLNENRHQQSLKDKKEHAMELLDRYLEAVRKAPALAAPGRHHRRTPRQPRSATGRKEEALGRPFTQAEAEEWIKQLGSPMQMAAPYQPQQYLIGPAVYPTYRYVLKLACTWVMLLYSIVTVVTIFAGRNPTADALLGGLLRLPGVLISVAAWVTLVFAVLEYLVMHGHIPADKLGPIANVWSPAMLPPLCAETVDGKKPKSFAVAVTEAIFGVFFLGWLLLVPQHPWMLFGPGAALLKASPYQLAPVWMQFYWCLVALNVLQVGWKIERLARGRWQRPQSIEKSVFKAIALIPTLLLLNAPDHMAILLRHPLLDQARLGSRLDAINLYVHTSALIVTAIVVVQLAWEVSQMSVNAWRKRAAAMQ
jgi:hypothetical protein